MSRLLRRFAAVALVAGPLVACAGDGTSSDAGSTAATPPPVPAAEPPPTASVPPAASATTTTTTATTTTAPTAVTLPPAPAPLPVPVPPPADDTAAEPVVPLGSVAIPALGIDRPLFDGIRLPTFDMGPGHWPGTALPGQPGNMVIGGHRTEGNADFADIDRLQPGDEVVVTDLAGAPFTYVVRSVEIADPFAPRIVYQTPEPTATLFACHPPGSVAQRVIVHLDLRA